jgi:tRNA dimethylallyltransferase
MPSDQSKIENPQSKILHCLTGPTAAGKSAVGIELAVRLNAEIVSLDSMAVYRGMDIGTAKPTADERRAVPHHLIDLVEPTDEFTLTEYLTAAERVAREIESRGRIALFVGGTPLYLKGLLRGIFQGPPADPELRARWAAIGREQGEAALHNRLRDVDPAAADRLHPRDTRRIIRALEVYEKTGRPISEWQRQFDQPRPAELCRVFALEWPTDELNARIDARVDAMFAAGLVEETRALLEASKRPGKTASQAVGYREVIEFLDGGEHDLAGTIALVKTRTRQFAKRQRTWFRSLVECRPMPLAGCFDPVETAEQIIRAMR